MTNLWWTSSRARLWKWIVRTGTPYHILLSAWPYFVFAQVSAVARILFPMATLERGEQLWKDPDNWLLWNPVDRKSIQRHGTDRHGDERKKQPLKVQFDQTFPPEHIKKEKTSGSVQHDLLYHRDQDHEQWQERCCPGVLVHDNKHTKWEDVKSQAREEAWIGNLNWRYENES